MRIAQTLDALNHVLDRPYQASFEAVHHATLRAIPGLYNDTPGNAVFDLAIHLALMGLDKHVENLKEIIADKTISEQDRLQNCKSYLYTLFNILSDDPKLTDHQNDLKKLKKLTHAFARENNFKLELFSVKKMWDRLSKAEASTERAQALDVLWKQDTDFRKRQFSLMLDKACSPSDSKTYLERLRDLRALQDDFEMRKATLTELRAEFEELTPELTGILDDLESDFQTCLAKLESIPASLKINEKDFQARNEAFQTYLNRLNVLWESLNTKNELKPKTIRLLKRLKGGGFPHQTYTTFDALNQFMKGDESASPITAFDYRDEEERKARQNDKFWIDILSFIISLMVGLGEGMIAAVFAFATFSPLVALLAVGLPGFACNFYLFRSDSYDILKDLWRPGVHTRLKIFEKMNGEELSTIEKIGVGISLLFSLSAAASCGFLSVSNGISAYSALLTLLGFSAHPVGVATLAIIIAVVTTIALFTVFSYITANFVRKGRPAVYWQGLKHFSRDCFDFWRPDNNTTLEGAEKAFHYSKKMAFSLFYTAFAALGLAAAVIVNVATTGFFLHHAKLALTSLCHLSQATANTAAWIIVVYLGAPCNSAFYVNAIRIAGDVSMQLWASLTSPQESTTAPKTENEEQTPFDTIRQTHNKITNVFRSFLLLCVGLNAFGQAEGANDATTKTWMRILLPFLLTKITTFITGIVLALGSAPPNGEACYEATELPDSDTKVNPDKAANLHKFFTVARKPVPLTDSLPSTASGSSCRTDSSIGSRNSDAPTSMIAAV